MPFIFGSKGTQNQWGFQTNVDKYNTPVIVNPTASYYAQSNCVGAFNPSSYNAITGTWTNLAPANATMASSYTFTTSTANTNFPTVVTDSANVLNNTLPITAVKGLAAGKSSITFYTFTIAFNWAIICVTRYVNTASNNNIIIGNNGFLGHFTASYFGVFAPGGTWVSPQSSYSGGGAKNSVNMWLINIAYIDTTTGYWVYRVNGVKRSSSAGGTSTVTAPYGNSNEMIGLNLNQSANTDYEIAELMVFNTGLSNAQATEMETALLTKYGIAVNG